MLLHLRKIMLYQDNFYLFKCSFYIYCCLKKKLIDHFWSSIDLLIDHFDHLILFTIIPPFWQLRYNLWYSEPNFQFLS